MSSAQDLTASNFDNTVGSGVTLVDFWAEWCGPCKMMTPVIDELASEYGDKVTVGKIDVDAEQELAMKFQVSSIPTLIVFKDGEVAERFVGVTSKSDLATALDAASK
jgi:thioredoxin 1